MKKVIALGLATVFSLSLTAGNGNGGANQQNWDTASTFLRFETPFQSASPERVSLFNSEDLRQKHRAQHNGDVQFIVFGGQNSNQNDAAAYYMPGGLTTLEFNASIDNLNQGTETAYTLWNGAIGGVTPAQLSGTAGAGVLGAATGTLTQYIPLTLTGNVGTTSGLLEYVNTTPATAAINNQPINSGTIPAGSLVVGTSGTTSETFNLDNLTGLINNTNSFMGNFVVDTNKNIGTMRPWNFGVGYAPDVQLNNQISESAFVSTITPELKRSYWGIGATWKQILSSKDVGFFLEVSTALQSLTMDMKLNEHVIQDLEVNPSTNASSYGETWANQGYDTGDTVPPIDMNQAFAQSAWEYGRIDGAQSVTRLADIELKLGYQFICEDNVMSNMFVGIVIPTGNKAQSKFLAEPIVGNGFHFGLLFGTTQEVQLDMGSETRWSMRSDAAFRYLFQNTQVRSFDTLSNGQWSRYMMVWENYAAEQIGELAATAGVLRNYTPGINVFTQDVNVTPRAQARINEAIVLEHGSFKAEFGWNMLIRQAEEVSLVNAWAPNNVTFVDASNNAVSMFNETRTIYNDSYQSSPVATGVAGASEALYNLVAITQSDLNIDSAASPAAFTNTPYLSLAYAFNEEKSSVFSIGASYEISATNGYINDWMLWGKFGFTF